MVVPGVVRRVIKAFPTLIQAVALVALLHLLGQGLIGKYGSSRYKFTRNQYSSFGAEKVQKVIKYIDKGNKMEMKKNVPKYTKKTTASTTTTTTTTTTPAPPPPLEELERQMESRVRGLRDTCARIHNSTNRVEGFTQLENKLRLASLSYRPVWQNLICSKEHHLSFCPSYKSASTFLLKKFLLISPAGKYDKESVKQLDGQANVLARKEFGYLENWDIYPSFVKEGTSIIFVRHPFIRLLSAFRDKLEDPMVQNKKFNEYYYNKYGRRVVMHYRREKITGRSFKYPRFHEFLEFILNRELRFDDEHWAPYFMSCSPCHIPYNFIGHFESLYWDIHLLASKTNLTKQWDDPTDYFQSGTNMDIVKEYYSLVDRDTIRKLYKRYEIDFELFGYSPDEYIAMGKPGPDDIVETSPKAKVEVEVDENVKLDSRADTTQSDHELLNKHLELEANSEEKQPEYQARPEQSEQ